MNINDYCHVENHMLSFTREHGSQFAKQVAGDFNPIHNIDARRFCVPGDLLFAVMLTRFGVASKTVVEFDGMVTDSMRINLPESAAGGITLSDEKGRQLLAIDYSATPFQHSEFVAALVEAYVRFSGQTFPDILVDLMRSEDVMINPDRPLVIYKRMTVELDIALEAQAVAAKGRELLLEYTGASLKKDAKKGEAQLNFTLKSGDDVIGKGHKIMLLGGLRAFDQVAVDGIVEEYNRARIAYPDPLLSPVHNPIHNPAHNPIHNPGKGK